MGHGKKVRGKEPTAQYTVVQQSYEDKDYENHPKPVLVPTAILKKKPRQPILQFGEDLPDDYSQRRNMLMVDDAPEERRGKKRREVTGEEDEEGEEHEDAKEAHEFFQDEVEEEFDTDFVKQMMKGTGEPPPPAIEKDSYPKHNDKRTLERQFEDAMGDFADDEDLDEEDPRAHGTSTVFQYGTALEQFVDEHAGDSAFSELPMRHRGLLNQLKIISANNRVFDTDKDGVFMTLLPDKKGRMAANYIRDTEDLKELTLEQIQNGGIDTQEVLQKTDEEAEGETEVVKLKAKDHGYDCETIMSTYSTLYNHPTVIAAATKKIRLPKKKTVVAARGAESMAEGAKDDGKDEQEGTQPSPAPPTDIGALCERSGEETAEERKMRQRAIKQLQRENRQTKKQLKNAYKQAHLEQAAQSSSKRQSRAEVPLSVK